MAEQDWDSVQAVMRASLDAIVIADDHGIVLEFNPAAEAMLGHSRDDALGRSIGDLIVPDRHRAAHEAGMTRYNSGRPARVLGRRMEMEAMRADGSIFPVELAITEARTGDRRYFAASLRDLTEKHAVERERAASAAFLQALVDDQTDIVIRSDAQFRVIFCNLAAARFFSVTREAMIGQCFSPGTAPNVQAQLARELRQLTPENPMRWSVDPSLRPSGETGWLEWSNRAVFDANGHLDGYLSVARDITDQRLAAAEIERTSRENDLYRRMFEAMPDSVYAKDREGRIVVANAALVQALGASSAADLIGKTDADLHPAEVAARYQAVEQALYDSGEESRIATVLIWQENGEENWQTTRKTLFRDEAGTVIGLIGHGRDVTIQVQAERALAVSEARFAAFAENAPVAMFLKDTEGRYVMLNAQAVQVIGSPHDQIIGRTAREVGTAPAADVTEAADRTLRATGQALYTIGPLTAPGAPYHWAMVLRFPIAAPDGDGLWIGGFAIDMTAQKTAEVDLERSREALHQSEKLNAMGSLLAGVAHELNNPLAIVVAQATMLEEDAGDGPLTRRAEKIRRAAERCGRIVQTFLGLARRKPAERSRVSLNDMARAAVDLMAYPLRTAGIGVVFNLADDLPAVDGDPDMLNQVVLNLLVNAQQALEGSDGLRTITLTTTRTATDAVIEVADTGGGVAAEIRHRVFEPFFSTKPQGTGTGVGLSFCHSVVTAHQGRLELLDGGTGATFRVSLPAAGPGPLAAPDQPKATPVAPVLGRALVIDDEAELAEAIAEMLAAGGYAVDVVTTATDAQARVRAAPYDVILSDLRMPGMDGSSFYAWLLAEAPDQAARIAFVTGDALGVAASAFLAHAGRPVLEKPFTRAGVLAVAAAARGA